MLDKLTVRSETITPEKARQMLVGNTENYRKLDEFRVKRYAADMRNRRWEANGETIKMNGAIVIDGQHRLHAIIEAQTTVAMLVVDGVESPLNVDTGKPRSVSDWLRHLKIQSSSAVAAAARYCVCYDKGLWASPSWKSSATTNVEVIDYAVENAESLVHSVSISSKCKPYVSQAILAAIMHIGCNRTNPFGNSLCTWFCTSLSSGSDISERDPVFLLRKRILKDAIKGTQGGKKELSGYSKRLLTTLAWNKTCLGESALMLRLNMTGPKKSDLPKEILIAGSVQ